MKKIWGLIVSILIVASVFVGAWMLFGARKQENEVPKTSIEEKIEEKLGGMSLEEKVGQMIIMTNDEKSLTRAFYEEILDVRPGGFILMVPNITTYAATKKMLGEIDALSREKMGLPMILATDEEGGNVQRLLYVEDKEATNIPYMYDVGKTGDERLAFSVGEVIGKETRSLGLNLTFAPDVDIFSNPENEVIGRRSFGEDKEVVTKMALATARGIESAGVGTAYKHFPGHGDTAVDSHAGLPVLNKSWEELSDFELYPFGRAIEAGAEMIMVGHIALVEGGEPASLSREAVTEVLRGKLGFLGLAVTDALNMGAVTEKYTDEEMAVKAVLAGEDLLLMPRDAKVAREAIVGAVKNGEIEVSRIDEAVRRILKYKYEKLENFTPGSEAEFGGHEEAVRLGRD
ncbi:glycoside hydrolase family 3 protein [Candidatus Saccharibacteria bacterium]|nr:glycoside hydrolase family 3 protein [Candidatus Saccharibacteria bacterium]